MYVFVSYDPEAVCGSFDADFTAFGPFATYDEACAASARIATKNGTEGDILHVTPVEANDE